MSLRGRLKSLYNYTYCLKFLFHFFFSPKLFYVAFVYWYFFPTKTFCQLHTWCVLKQQYNTLYTLYFRHHSLILISVKFKYSATLTKIYKLNINKNSLSAPLSNRIVFYFCHLHFVQWILSRIICKSHQNFSVSITVCLSRSWNLFKFHIWSQTAERILCSQVCLHNVA